MSHETYEAACYRASMEQGLAEPVLALAAAGYGVSVDQTGGMTMCARVDAGPKPDDPQPDCPPEGSYVWVTREAPDLFMVCLYPYDKADPEAEPAYESSRDVEVRLADVVHTVCAFLTGRPNFDGEVWHHPVNGHILDADECEALNLDPSLRDR